MAMTSCKECSKPLSDLASSCPHCGAPASRAIPTPADREEASRQELRSAAVALPIILVLAFGFWYIFVSDRKTDALEQPQQEAQRELTIAERYPAPWQTDIRGEISSTLASKQARGCGVYAYRQSVNSTSEFLVYCSPDGIKNWTAYQVWPNLNDVIGPMLPDPQIPSPAL